MLCCIHVRCGDDKCYRLDDIRYDAAGNIIFDIRVVGRLQREGLGRRNRDTHENLEDKADAVL